MYLDTAKGISFDEITAAQVWVNEIMDEIDPFPGAYTLEVSSPGIDRPLRTPEHFERFAGDEAYVVTNGPIEGRSRLRARSRALTPKTECVLLDVDGARCDIPLADIKKAHVKGVVEFR